jgi:hypothetical protein
MIVDRIRKRSALDSQHFTFAAARQGSSDRFKAALLSRPCGLHEEVKAGAMDHGDGGTKCMPITV